jgi:hypothetical protein
MTKPSARDKRLRQNPSEHIDRAARVLTALTEDRSPDPDDVAELQRFAPEAAGKTIDEMVCFVIQKVLDYRANGNRRTHSEADESVL